MPMREAVHEQFLSFFIAGEEYALAIHHVREILEYAVPTKVPSMPPAVRGVVNLRGAVVPVLDLALHFGLAETAITKRTCIVMVEARWEGQDGIVGLICEAVSQVSDVERERIQDAPSFGTRLRTDFLRGVFEASGRFVLVLDLDRLLDETHFLAISAGESQAPSSSADESAASTDDGPSPDPGGEAAVVEVSSDNGFESGREA